MMAQHPLLGARDSQICRTRRPGRVVTTEAGRDRIAYARPRM